MVRRYLFGLAEEFPIAHIGSDLHNRHLRREFRIFLSNILHDHRLAVKMVDMRILALAQFLGITHSRKNESIQSSHSSSCIGDVLALLQFEVVAVLVKRLPWLELLSGRRVVELAPVIGVGEDGIGAFESGHKRIFIVQVGFDHFDAFGAPGLGFGWVAGNATDFPSGLFGIELCDGAAL